MDLKPYYDESGITLYHGDCLSVLRVLEAESVQTCVTSPPYWGLRDYGIEGQLGLEATPEEYVEKLVGIFREVWRVLKNNGTVWLNLGDTYSTNIGGNRNGHSNTTWENAKKEKERSSVIGTTRLRANAKEYGLKQKDLVGIPWRVAFALQADGWYLRQDIIWHKPNPMPESVQDRCTKAHEYLFLLSKSQTYYYNAGAIQEPLQTDPSENYPNRATTLGRGNQRYPGKQQDKSGGFPLNGDGRNKRSVWTVPVTPYKEAHFATFPKKLIEPCIMAGTKPGEVVLDPFLGSGTTAYVAKSLNRQAVGIELNSEYLALCEKRLSQEVLQF